MYLTEIMRHLLGHLEADVEKDWGQIWGILTIVSRKSETNFNKNIKPLIVKNKRKAR